MNTGGRGVEDDDDDVLFETDAGFRIALADYMARLDAGLIEDPPEQSTGAQAIPTEPRMLQ